MPVQINNPSFAPPPSGFIPNSGGSQPSVKRESFLDYFPNTREHYKGYIKQSIFENKMREALRQSVQSAGSLRARSVKLAERPNLIIVPEEFRRESESSIDQSGLNKMRDEGAVRDYYEGIRTDLLQRVWGEEWRTSSEMNMSAEMYAQSSAYFKTAFKEIGVAVATFGTGKAFGKTLTKYSGRTVNKFISPDTKLNKIIGKGLGKEFKIGKGIFTAEFQGLGQLMDKSIEGAVDLGDHLLTSDKMKQYSGFDPDYFGNNWLGNSVDFVASYHPMLAPSTAIQKKLLGDDIIRKGADFATDLIPVVSYCKTGVTSLTNIALYVHTRQTAHRMKDMEDRGNAAERNFNQKLKQTIYDDVEALSYNDIKCLMEEVGLTEL